MNDLVKPIVDIKAQLSDVEEVEIDIIPVLNKSNQEAEDIAELDKRISELESKIKRRNDKIDQLESHADWLDYIVAMSCGILTGVLDVLFVGEFSFESANQWGTEKCNNFVMNFANKSVSKDARFEKNFKFNNLSDAIEYLEKKYRVNYDVANTVMGNGDHHLFDFAHHPSLLGLIISIVSQLSGKTYGWSTKDNIFTWVDVTHSSAQVGGSNVFERIFNAIVTWAGHLISDMAGSSSAKHGGAGIPGPIMSMLQEGARHFKKGDKDAQTHFQSWLNDAYKGKLKGQNGTPFDLRTELGTYAHLGKQTLVVAINEIVVRAFYFIRHFIKEIKEENIKSFREINRIKWKNVLPFKNRTIVRMLTVSMATLTAVDIAEAGISAAVKSGGNIQAFLTNFVLRINYVGIGRTIIAGGTDIVMAIQLDHNRRKRIEELNEYIFLNNAKLFYKQDELWLIAADVDKSINYTMKMAVQSKELFEKCFNENKEDIITISNSINRADEKNKGLKDDIKNILKWGSER